MTKSKNTPSTMTAMRWSGVRTVARQVFSFITPIILARLLTPADFGLIAMAMVFAGISQLIADFGTGDAIIQRKKVDSVLLSSVFFFNISVSIAVFLTLSLSAGLISGLYEQPLVKDLVIALSFVILIQGVNIVPVSLLRKNKNIFEIAIAEIVSQIFSAILAVYLAAVGEGVWTLVWYAISKSVIYTAITWFSSGWAPVLRFEFNQLNKIFNFSFKLTGVKFLNYVERNADKYIVGTLSGDVALGVYSRSYATSQSIYRGLSGFFNPVFFSVLSKNKNDPRYLHAMMVKSYQAFLLVTPLIAVFFCLLAEELVLTVFGEKWLAMTSLLPVFGLMILFRPLHKLNVQIFKAVNRVDIMLRLWLVFTPICVSGFYVGAKYYGIFGVAVSYLVTSFGLFFYSTLYVCDAIQLSFMEMWRKCFIVIARAILLFSVMVLYKLNILPLMDDISIFLGMFLAGMLLFAMYIIMRKVLPLEVEDEIMVFAGLGKLARK